MSYDYERRYRNKCGECAHWTSDHDGDYYDEMGIEAEGVCSLEFPLWLDSELKISDENRKTYVYDTCSFIKTRCRCNE